MLSSLVLRTPLLPFQTDEPQLVGRIFMKAENLQSFGSYKIRGVKSAIDVAQSHQLKEGLVTISAGNMAQAVAYAAKKLNIPCRVYIPDSAPEVKRTAIKRIGAEIISRPFSEIWNAVKEGLESEKGLLIHPTRTLGLTEGYGSIVDEIIQDLEVVDAIVIPFGVGGLSLGLSRRIKKLMPSIPIYLCETATAAPLKAALDLGRPVQVNRNPSFIDAIGTPMVLPEVFKEISNLIAGSLVMDLTAIEVAFRNLVLNQKLVVEGAAATALAAALKLARESNYRRIVCILSGGNISPEYFHRF